MILNADIVHQILGGKRSMIRLPAEGRKPSVGHVYAVRTPEDRKIRCHITVTSIVEHEITEGKHGSSWEIRFQKGDHADTPRIPAARFGAHGDYVTNASRALSGAAEEIPAATQGIYAEQASNGGTELRNGQWRTDRARLLKVVQEIRLEIAKQNCGSSSARRRLKTVEHNLRALQREMAA